MDLVRGQARSSYSTSPISLPGRGTSHSGKNVQLVLSTDRTLTVRTRGDIPVPHHPDRATHHPGELDPTAPPLSSDHHGDRFALDYVVMVMTQHHS